MHGISLGDVAVQAAAVAKPSVWDTIGNVITKVVQPAANVYTQIKTNQPVQSSTSPGYTQPSYLPTSAPPPPAPEPDNTKKYLMIGGAILIAGTGIYFLTRKKKGK